MNNSQAKQIAEEILYKHCSSCQRAIIAGSIRRGKPEVYDIEIVCQPKLTGGLWGDEPDPVFYERLDANPPGKVIKSGMKYRQYELPEGINLDLFIVTPPAQWGVILAIRTGPARLSQLMVTRRSIGGLLPSWANVSGGTVGGAAQALEFPEESDFLKFIGISGMTPEERQAKYG